MTPARDLTTTPYNWLETEENKHTYVAARVAMLPPEKQSVGIRERLAGRTSPRALLTASSAVAGIRGGRS